MRYIYVGRQRLHLERYYNESRTCTRSIRMYGSEMQAMPIAQYQNVPKKQRPTSSTATALVSRVTNTATTTAGNFARFGCVSLSHCWAS